MTPVAPTSTSFDCVTRARYGSYCTNKVAGTTGNSTQSARSAVEVLAKKVFGAPASRVEPVGEHVLNMPQVWRAYR